MCSFVPDDAPRLKAADLARLAQQRLQELQAAGEDVHPVVGKGKKLAAHFWGSAWMKHLSLCESGGLNLAPGRTLLRHGCVLDVRVEPCAIHALVSADRLYTVQLRLKPLDEERLETLKTLCHGRVESAVSLLEGRVDEAVLTHLCDPDAGLLPDPADWKMSCDCTDWSEPCAHAAAAVYAAGVLADADPSLLFTLRGISAQELMQPPAAPTTPAADFDAAALSAVFGIDLDIPDAGK